MVEQIPFSFILYNGMVRGPTHYRSEDDTLIGERSVRIVADGVTQAVRIAGGVGEIIFAVVFVHPTGFEETAFIVASRQRFAILIQNDNGFRLFCKFQHIFAEFGHTSGESLFVAFGQNGTFQSFIVAIALQLATPQTAEIHVEITVSIIQDGRVDVTAFHRIGLRNERSFRIVTDSYTDAENIVLVFQGEIHIIFSVFPGYVAVP